MQEPQEYWNYKAKAEKVVFKKRRIICVIIVENIKFLYVIELLKSVKTGHFYVDDDN
jgi:hypothetical protein